MSKSLKQRVIAEGVETPEQYAFLLAEQCDEGQGYYFGRPVVAEALATLLQKDVLPTLPHWGRRGPRNGSRRDIAHGQ